MGDEKVQPQNPEGETPGKVPGEGAGPTEAEVDPHANQTFGDADSAATGTTPTEGGGDATTGTPAGDTGGGATGTTPTEGGGDPGGGPGTEGGGP